MHPRNATLVAFCDAEAGQGRSRRISTHLEKCEECRRRLRRIRSEKDQLSAGATEAAMDSRQGLTAVLSAIGAWRNSRNSAGASQLTRRLRREIETYFGSPAVVALERPGMRSEELLGQASAMFDVFLGEEAAEAVRDQLLSGLAEARPLEETCR